MGRKEANRVSDAARPSPIPGRFKRNRSGAAYPLKPDEILQARSPLSGDSGGWGRFFLRITQSAHREKAEYWFHSDPDFISTTDELSHEEMQRVSQALAELVAAAEEYQPDIDANDSGRSIIFWSGTERVTVFIPSHPASYQPPMPCLLAFDRLWTILTGQS
jgi:hypothetical protein